MTMSLDKVNEIYSLASYSAQEASHYLAIPISTVRYWCLGKNDVSGPLVIPAESSPLALSFLNIVELHVLGSIRRVHEVPMKNVRSALNFLEKKLGTKRPLATKEILTDGITLFVEHFGSLVNLNAEGQLAIKSVMSESLTRVVWDDAGLPIKLFPFTRKSLEDAPRVVVIDPELSFGRPVLAGRGVPTEVIAERYKAGDSIVNLVTDYGCEQEEIEEAIRCELEAA